MNRAALFRARTFSLLPSPARISSRRRATCDKRLKKKEEEEEVKKKRVLVL